MSNILKFETAKAKRIAAEVAACGSLDKAILHATQADDGQALADLLAERVKSDPAAEQRSILRQIRDIETQVADLMEEASVYAGRAAGRKLRAVEMEPGPFRDAELTQAASFYAMADAREALVVDLMAKSIGLQWKVANLAAQSDGLEGLLDAVRSITGAG